MLNDNFDFLITFIVGIIFGFIISSIFIPSIIPNNHLEKIAKQICTAQGLEFVSYEKDTSSNQDKIYKEIVCGQPKEKLIDDLVFVIKSD